MTDQATRPVPTPATIALPRRGFDRDRWVSAVLYSNLTRHDRLLALVLAHHAGVLGELPAGGDAQQAGHLARDMRLDAKRVRDALKALELAGWIRRPDIRTWQRKDLIRPITLTIPSPAAQTEPAHTGEHPS
jgi:hypothetical protein